MFCTSLRRRPSFSSGVSNLASTLGLRENHLETHDIEVAIGNASAPSARDTPASRRVRLLLLAPSSISDDKLQTTIERIMHFGSLTGGEDVAIMFLLKTPDAANLTRASNLANNSADSDGVLAYSRLQAELLNRPEIPHVHVLPVSSLDSLPNLIKRHISHLSRPPLSQKPAATSFELLHLCTAEPPMSQQTAFVLTDLFPDLRELAMTCWTVSGAPDFSSPTSRIASQISGNQESSQVFGSSAVDKLKRLRVLVGDRECQDIIEFWKDEWVVD